MIVSRLKVLAKMDIAEKRIPQDGAIALRTADKRIDLRVNTVPTVYGEKMVMRILDKGAIPLDLTGLGLDQRQSNDLFEAIQSPYGLALVTGPTGSGKSTTLYSCLNQLNEVFYRPKGCLQCRRLGYRGRVGVFEVIRITSRLTQLIQKRAPLDQLRKAAREEGMKMLFDSALDKVRQGLTSLEAAMSVTMAEES